MSFTFNGVKKDYLRVLVGLERPAWAPIEEEVLEIPGRPGGIITKQHTKIRRLNIPVRVYKRGFNSLEELEEDLAAWLVTDEPKPLEFDHKPNRVYYAKVTGELIFTEYPQWADGVISFICPDPYKYGPELEAVFPTDVVTLTNEGTAETEPIIEVKIKKSTPFVAVSNGEKLNMIGDYVEADRPTYEPETLVLHDGLSSTVGWTTSTSVEEGEITGSIATSGGSFYVSDWGEGNLWHGPALKRSFGDPLQHFMIEVEAAMNGEYGQVGGLEIALLDANNQFVAKFLLTKRVAERLKNYVRVQIGKYDDGVRDITGGDLNIFSDWQPFEGKLWLGRRNNVWTVQIGQEIEFGPSTIYKPFYSIDWRDYEEKHMTPIAQIQLQFWAYSDVPTLSDVRFKDLKIYRSNVGQIDSFPYVARPGDTIIFDHVNDNIFKNGESIIKRKAFIGDYFKLRPGLNRIAVEPADAIESTKVRYRTKWL